MCERDREEKGMCVCKRVCLRERGREREEEDEKEREGGRENTIRVYPQETTS